MADVDRYKNEFEAGEFVRVEGRGSIYNGEVQLVLSTIRRVNPDQDRREGFREEDAILSAPRPIDEMWSELQEHLKSVKNDHVRVLLNRMVVDHEAQLRVWPAAQVIHHAYRGGFLEHITKMAEVGRLVSNAYGADWDLVLRRHRAARHRQAPGAGLRRRRRRVTRATGTWWDTSRWGS